MLRKLIAKHVISEAEAIELLPEFASLNPPEPGSDARADKDMQKVLAAN